MARPRPVTGLAVLSLLAGCASSVTSNHGDAALDGGDFDRAEVIVDAAPSDDLALDVGALDVAAFDAPRVCTTNAECDGLAWCFGRGCGTPGSCRPAPVGTPVGLCDQPMEPVCGCDGRTYRNECAAVLSRVRVASQGACTPPLDAAPATDGG